MGKGADMRKGKEEEMGMRRRREERG